jgi:hypothetical protein
MARSSRNYKANTNIKAKPRTLSLLIPCFAKMSAKALYLLYSPCKNFREPKALTEASMQLNPDPSNIHLIAFVESDSTIE